MEARICHLKYEMEQVYHKYELKCHSSEIYHTGLYGFAKTLLPYSKKYLGSKSSLGSFSLDFECSPCTWVGSLWVLQVPPAGQKKYLTVIFRRLNFQF